jgi:hypothetical protein
VTPLVAICWAIGVVAVWRRVVAVRRNAFELLSPTTVVVAGFAWLYFIGYLTLDQPTSAAYLSPEGYSKILVLAVLSEFAFALGVARSKARRFRAVDFDPGALYCLAVVLTGAGAFGWGYFVSLSGGFFEYYGAEHGTAGAWSQTSAYLYGSIYLMFSGILILSWLQSKRRLGAAGRVILGSSAAFLLFDAWAAGSRGHILRLGLLGCVYLLFLRQGGFRSRVIVVTLLALLPMAFVAVPFLRTASYPGAEQSFAESIQRMGEAISGLAESGPGHEVVYASGLVQAAWEQGEFDFGYLWLHPIINLVPRRLWPEKPYAAEFSVDNRLLLWRSFGWVPTEGAAPTGLADAFVRFSWASPVMWAIFGWLGGRLFQLARYRGDVASASYFFCYLVGLSYLLTQELNAATYSSLLIAVPLAVGLPLAGRIRRKASG